MRVLILVLLFVCVNAVEIQNDDSAWSLISQYALGVWKYLNSTMVLPSIPHS